MLFNLVELIRGKLMPAEGSAAMGLLYAGGVLLCIAVGYLLGSLNPAVLVARVGFREDIKRAGHGNAEATDIADAYGKRAGIVTAALNFAKGFAASLLGLFIWEMNGLAISGLFALLGAMFPCFNRFRGGRGAEVMAGMILAVSILTTGFPIVFLLLLLIFLIVIVVVPISFTASSAAAILCLQSLVFLFIFTQPFHPRHFFLLLFKPIFFVASI